MEFREFYLKTIISMAGNPYYVDMVSKLIRGKYEDTHTMSVDELIRDAEKLCASVKEMHPEFFDEEQQGEKFSIAEHLSVTNGFLDEIESNLSGINQKLSREED